MARYSEAIPSKTHVIAMAKPEAIPSKLAMMPITPKRLHSKWQGIASLRLQ